jgi:hypothetical protein
MRERRSTDLYVLAKLALSGGIRTRDDLLELLSDPAPREAMALA